ncbi:hypothetical protein AHF37_08856 [Paragonimus kellicotti]|nr:hypothetical protein AHF37_08856 [Paragonimus kellicotti]
MRLLTPEIAWHETLPIYSCDLQPYVTSIQGFSIADVGKSSQRVPLTELSSGLDLSGALREDHSYQEWTRLATAGGDNVVRLWRVRLAWISTTSRPVPSEPIGLQPSVAAKKVADPKRKSLSSLADHLTYLASLKRHEKPVNVVRWSPSGLSDMLTIAFFLHLLSQQFRSRFSSLLGGRIGKFIDNRGSCMFIHLPT